MSRATEAKGKKKRERKKKERTSAILEAVFRARAAALDRTMAHDNNDDAEHIVIVVDGIESKHSLYTATAN